MNDTNDIEEEIRRRILAERTVAGANPASPNNIQAPPEAANGAATPGTGNDHGAQPYYVQPKNPSYLQRKQQQGGVIGAIATILLVLAKFGAPVLALLVKLKFLLVGLKFFKIFLTLGSMLVSMWLYATIYKWPFAVGIVLLILIHECGHALAAKMRGHDIGMMVFVPFMGAFVSTRGQDRNIVESAFIGIMGPVVGTLGCLVCVGLYWATGSLLWLALAQWGFFVNLFNLAPTVPLDGGWIVPLFSPKLLAFGAVLLFFIGFRNPLIWILALLSIPRIIAGWKADSKTQPYFQATTADRWRYGLAYFGLAAFLGIGYLLLHGYLQAHLPVVA